MKTNRRKFLETIGLSGAGIAATSLTSFTKGNKTNHLTPHKMSNKKHSQRFNMCGYAAPPIDIVRIGIVGIGSRGLGAVKRLRLIEGVEIKGICASVKERVDSPQELLKEMNMPPAKSYYRDEEVWKKMCQDPDLDLIYIVTPRTLHADMCIFSMENGKHAATEVPAVRKFEDTWRLVETSERTKKHCCILENCTYDFWALLNLNMARQGFYGEVIHADVGYLHDLRDRNVIKGSWRIDEYMERDGSLYPTHGLGPACQVLDINRGDRLDYLTSVSSDDFTMNVKIAELANRDDYYKKYVGRWGLGSINTTTLRTQKGKTIMLQYNTSNPLPYSRIQQVIGTEAITQKDPLPSRISRGHEWLSEEDTNAIAEKFTPRIVKLVGEMAKKVGGHGGQDFLMDWRLMDGLGNELPIDQDVYDAAAWSSVVPLSEWSVANSAAPVSIPDYTCGSFLSNTPVDLELNRGGNTGMKEMP